MKELLNRIKIISDNEGIGITNLEKKIGASKGVLSRALSRNTDIQSKWLLKIVENYPEYNSEWLLTGKGNMIRGDHNKIVNQNIKGNRNYMGGKSLKINEEYNELATQIKKLKSKIKEKDKLIKKLVEQQQKLIEKL